MKYLQIFNNEVVAMSHENMGVGEGIFTIDNPNDLPLQLGISYDYTINGDMITLLVIKDTVTEIDKSWELKYSDYKQAREHIRQIVIDAGFDSLSIAEQRIAAKWFVVTPEQISSVLTFGEQLKASNEFNRRSIDSRVARWESSKSFLYSVLDTQDSITVMNIIVEKQFEMLYTRMGQEGTTSKNYKGIYDSVGLYDFIQSTVGTEWETTGLLNLGLTPLHDFTTQQVIERVMDILQNGNY